LSALFLLAPQLRIGTHLIDRAEKPATPSYAALTLSLLAQKGWVWEPQDNGWTLSAKPDVACPLQYKGEKDWNAGGYFWGWIALGAGSLTLSLSMEALQPERQLFPTLPWPVYFQVTAEGIHIESREAVLPPLDIDISDYPDTVPVLAVVSAFASGTSRLSGIHTLPHKESHRLRALATELARVGAHLTWDDTALWIEPLSRMPDYPIVLDSHRDHRIAMALSLLASRSKAPIYITSPECVAKSYPTYWQTLAAVGVECTFVS
jgi:3-phosphoshikimate 1-carboxyvinyltransferase